MADRPAIVSCVFYKDPIAAMKWLEKAFGFETTTLFTDADGNLGYAEMEFRGAPISIGGEFGGPLLGGAQMKSPLAFGESHARPARPRPWVWRSATTVSVRAPDRRPSSRATSLVEPTSS